MSKKTIIISAIIAAVAVAGISTTFIVISLINAPKADDDIYVVQDVVEMSYTLAGFKSVDCWAETFIEWEFTSSKPHINLYLQLRDPNDHFSTLTWGSTTHVSGVFDVTDLPGHYSFCVWNIDDDKERINVSFQLRYDNPWYQGDGTPGW